MDEEEEIQSHRPPKPPPSPPQPNGRLTVAAPTPATAIPIAVAATAVTAPTHTLTLALPIQQSKPSGREDCWSEGATAILIESWGERYLELNRGNLKQKHWKDVADAVSSREDYTKTPKTDIQCKNRVDTIKKKYKQEKAKILNGAGVCKWPFFHKLDYLIGQNRKTTGGGGGGPAPPPPPPPPPIRQFQHQMPGSDRNSGSSKSGDSTDSFPPETVNGKKRRIGDNNPFGGGGGPMRELTRAILKFGEVYERVESSKLQQIMDLEKQRMGFTKEMELQRMQFFMKTQMELTQMKYGKIGEQ